MRNAKKMHARKGGIFRTARRPQNESMVARIRGGGKNSVHSL